MRKLGIIVFFVVAVYGYSSETPETIMSSGVISKERMVNFLLKNNLTLYIQKDFVTNLIDLYISEAEYEGVNYEIAFAQMCYHTNYLRFAGTLWKKIPTTFADCLLWIIITKRIFLTQSKPA